MCAYEREVCIYIVEEDEQLADDDQFRWPAWESAGSISTAWRRSKREPSRELNGWFEHAFSPGLYYQPGLKDWASPRHAAKTFGPGWYLKPGPLPLTNRDLWRAVHIDGNGPSGRDH